jgi:hypothetical protein
MLKDVVSNLKVVSSLLPAVRTADANGSAADLQDFSGCMVVAHIGAPGDTLSGSVKIEMELEHSDDNSTFVDCADADLSTAVTGTNTGTFAVIDANGEASQAYKVGYKGNKRYVRVVYNITGTHTTGTAGSALIIPGKPKAAPVA